MRSAAWVALTGLLQGTWPSAMASTGGLRAGPSGLDRSFDLNVDRSLTFNPSRPALWRLDWESNFRPDPSNDCKRAEFKSRCDWSKSGTNNPGFFACFNDNSLEGRLDGLDRCNWTISDTVLDPQSLSADSPDAVEVKNQELYLRRLFQPLVQSEAEATRLGIQNTRWHREGWSRMPIYSCGDYALDRSGWLLMDFRLFGLRASRPARAPYYALTDGAKNYLGGSSGTLSETDIVSKDEINTVVDMWKDEIKATAGLNNFFKFKGRCDFTAINQAADDWGVAWKEEYRARVYEVIDRDDRGNPKPPVTKPDFMSVVSRQAYFSYWLMLSQLADIKQCNQAADYYTWKPNTDSVRDLLNGLAHRTCPFATSLLTSQFWPESPDTIAAVAMAPKEKRFLPSIAPYRSTPAVKAPPLNENGIGKRWHGYAKSHYDGPRENPEFRYEACLKLPGGAKPKYGAGVNAAFWTMPTVCNPGYGFDKSPREARIDPLCVPKYSPYQPIWGGDSELVTPAPARRQSPSSDWGFDLRSSNDLLPLITPEERPFTFVDPLTGLRASSKKAYNWEMDVPEIWQWESSWRRNATVGFYLGSYNEKGRLVGNYGRTVSQRHAALGLQLNSTPSDASARGQANDLYHSRYNVFTSDFSSVGARMMMNSFAAGIPYVNDWVDPLIGHAGAGKDPYRADGGFSRMRRLKFPGSDEMPPMEQYILLQTSMKSGGADNTNVSIVVDDQERMTGQGCLDRSAWIGKKFQYPYVEGRETNPFRTRGCHHYFPSTVRKLDTVALDSRFSEPSQKSPKHPLFKGLASGVPVVGLFASPNSLSNDNFASASRMRVLAFTAAERPEVGQLLVDIRSPGNWGQKDYAGEVLRYMEQAPSMFPVASTVVMNSDDNATVFKWIRTFKPCSDAERADPKSGCVENTSAKSTSCTMPCRGRGFFLNGRCLSYIAPAGTRTSIVGGKASYLGSAPTARPVGIELAKVIPADRTALPVTAAPLELSEQMDQWNDWYDQARANTLKDPDIPEIKKDFSNSPRTGFDLLSKEENAKYSNRWGIYFEPYCRPTPDLCDGVASPSGRTSGGSSPTTAIRPK